jgi:hypothetical protein
MKINKGGGMFAPNGIARDGGSFRSHLRGS